MTRLDEAREFFANHDDITGDDIDEMELPVSIAADFADKCVAQAVRDERERIARAIDVTHGAAPERFDARCIDGAEYLTARFKDTFEWDPIHNTYDHRQRNTVPAYFDAGARAARELEKTR